MDDATIKSPFCRELRSKRFYFVNGLATRAEDYLDDSNHCWCFLTQEPVGPDGSKVHPNGCGPGRGCYRSALLDTV